VPDSEKISVLFARKRDERREVTDHLLRLRALISRGRVGIDFKPSVTQPPNQPPRWLAMLRSADSENRLGNVSFSFYRSDDAPTAQDLLHVLDDVLEACYTGAVARFYIEPSRLHIELDQSQNRDRISADLIFERA
jgi:hypothetical protein